MKRIKFLLGGLLVLSCGCSTMSNTDAGILGGGVIGAALGTVVGGITGHPGLGAAVGAGAGAVTGGLVGASEDRQQQQAAAQAAAIANSRPPMTLQDVVNMTQGHAGDSVIINAIRSSGSVYNLTSNDILWLRQNGVSEIVVNEMLSRRPGMVAVPGGPPPGAVVVDPYGAPVVGVGYGWYGPRRYYYYH